MKKNLSAQYNGISKTYEDLRKGFNEVSDNSFKRILKSILPKTNHIMDLACGNGDMIKYFQSLNIHTVGVDSSFEMVALAQKHTGADVRCEDFMQTSFENESFDLITSKWAMQTSPKIDPIYQEAHRLLKKDGYFVFLVVHPIRQFLEKKKAKKNYFKKEIVDSIIFDGAITVQEPTHTLREWFSEAFLSLFTLKGIEEGAEFPAAEQITGDTYPTYLIITAQKK